MKTSNLTFEQREAISKYVGQTRAALIMLTEERDSARAMHRELMVTVANLSIECEQLKRKLA